MAQHQIKKVAVAGGTGNLGPSIVSALLAAGFTVTVLTRSSSSSVPSGASSAVVDYDDQSTLVSALKGQDAVVSNLGSSALDKQQASLIDAAVAAGVSRFIPSEFGSNTVNPLAAKLPVFGAKIKIQNKLKEKAEKGQISYTLIMTGGFLDWGIEKGFLVNLTPGKTAEIYDGGDRLFSATTLDDIGKAVAGSLTHAAETKDRVVYVNSAAVSQNGLIKAAEKAKPGLKIETVQKSTDDIYNQSLEVLKSGEGNIGSAMIGFLRKAITGEGYGAHFEKTDNELLGIKVLSEGEVEKLVASIV